MVRAKTALAKHVGRLVLTAAVREGRPVYKVTGNISVSPDSGAEQCRKQLVARDGIERHYTPLEIPLNGVFLDPRLELR